MQNVKTNSRNDLLKDEITTVLVDDHELARRAVRSILHRDPHIKVVGEAAKSPEAIRLISRLKPDVTILDIKLGDDSGIDVARAVKVNAPNTKILVLSAYDDERYVNALTRLGVCGYLMKTASATELRRAVHETVDGGLVFPAAVAKTVSSLLQENGGRVDATGAGGRNDNVAVNATRRERVLTGRELQVLKLIARGLRNREIGNAMGIASKTVEAHIRHIRMKLDTRSRTQAVVKALKNGWLHE